MPSKVGPLGRVKPELYTRAQGCCDSLVIPSAAGGTIMTTTIQGLTTPATGPTAAVNAVPGLLNGSYRYRVVLATRVKFDYTDPQSNGSPQSNLVSPVNQQVNLTGIPIGVSTLENVTYRDLYRTKAGGSQFFYIDTISNNSTTTYTDNVPDSELGLVDIEELHPNQINPRCLYGIAFNIASGVASVATVYDGQGIAEGKVIWNFSKTGAVGGEQKLWLPSRPVQCRNGLAVSVTGLGSTVIAYWS